MQHCSLTFKRCIGSIQSKVVALMFYILHQCLRYDRRFQNYIFVLKNSSWIVKEWGYSGSIYPIVALMSVYYIIVCDMTEGSRIAQLVEAGWRMYALLNWVIIGSGNGLVSGRCQAITCVKRYILCVCPWVCAHEVDYLPKNPTLNCYTHRKYLIKQLYEWSCGISVLNSQMAMK